MKKADNPVVIVNGDNNNVEVKVTVTEAPSNPPAAVVIARYAFAAVAVLAVSHCCPDLLADIVRWIISFVNGG